MGKYRADKVEKQESSQKYSQIEERGSQQPFESQQPQNNTKKINSSNQISKNKSKLGRPSTKDKSTMPILKYNEIDLIKHSFLKYLLSIGFEEGLVFTSKQRFQLQKQQLKQNKLLPQICWDSQHAWVLQQELKKVGQIVEKQVMPFLPIQMRKQNIYNNLIDIADIFPRQITNEIYTFLCHLFIILLKNEENQTKNNEQEIKQFVNQIKENSNYIFLTGKFSKLQKASKPQKIWSEMQTLCKNIIKQFSNMYKMIK